MSETTPIPPSTRQQVFTATAGQTVFGPLNFQLFAAADLQVAVKLAAGAAYGTLDPAAYTITPAAPATDWPAFPQILLTTPRAAGDLVRFKGLRRGERTTNVTRGGVIQSVDLERELDRQVVTEQELRRDIDEAGAPLADLNELVASAEAAVAAVTEIVGDAQSIANQAQSYATLSGTSATQAAASASDAADTLTEVQAVATAMIPRNYVNLIENSQMSVCSTLLPTRVGNPISASSYSSYPGAGGGSVMFNTSGTGGLTAGKLFLVEGATAPRPGLVNTGCTVTSNKRITCTPGQLNGISVGNWIRITDSNFGLPLADCKIIATDGSSYMEIFGGTSGSILPNGSGTFSCTFYAGPAAVDVTVNGYPASPLAYFEAQPGCSLQAIEVSSNKVYATLSGWYSSALNSSAALLWELTPGDAGLNLGDACDGWLKSQSLRYWRTFDKDWDGVTPVTRPGALYGCKVRKASASTEYLYKPMCQKGGFSRTKINPAILRNYQGRQVSFGMEWWSPTASTARPFIFDGTDYHYGPYFTAGGFDWKEVMVTLPQTATDFRVGIAIDGAIGDYHYGTQPMAMFGGPIGRGNYTPWHGTLYPNFHQHPLKMVGYPAIPSLVNMRIEQQTNGVISRDVIATLLDLEGVPTPNGSSIFLMDGVETYSPGIVLIGQIPGHTYHMLGEQISGQLVVATPSGSFISENWVLAPNSTDWTSMTIDTIAYRM